MAFFTRKGFTVPELPHEGTLTEEPEEPYCSQSSASSQCHQLNRVPSSQHSGDGSDGEDFESTGCLPATTTATTITATHSTTGVSLPETTKLVVAQNDANDVEKFDYVIDRTYGVEV